MNKSKIRGYDKWGAGHYLASRDGRSHNGVDFCHNDREDIKAEFSGIVSKIGFPYNPRDEKKGHLRYVEIVCAKGYGARYFYVAPLVEKYDEVLKGQLIGRCQSLQGIYPEIQDHVHFEVKKEGQFVNPHHYLEGIL